MWLKSTRLQYAYKVHVSDCKWVCSGQMNDVRCIRHFVTVMCLGEIGLYALQHKLCFSTRLFAFHRVGDHRNEILSSVWAAEENVCKRTLSQQWCLKKLHLHSCRRNKVYAIVKAEKTYCDIELKTEPQDITLQVLHNHLAKLHFKLFSVRL